MTDDLSLVVISPIAKTPATESSERGSWFKSFSVC